MSRECPLWRDEAHLQPKAIACLEPRHSRETLKLPTKFFEDTAVMSQSFKAALRTAYATDYQVCLWVLLFLGAC